MPQKLNKNLANDSCKEAKKCMDRCIAKLSQLGRGTAQDWFDYFSLSLRLKMQPDQSNEKEELYLELTRKLYLMRKHRFEKEGKYTNLSEAIRQVMEDQTNMITLKRKKHEITDEEKIGEIYNQYSPYVFRGLPASFVL